MYWQADLSDEILEDLEEGIAIINQGDQLVRLNSSFCSLLNLDSKDLVGRRLMDFGLPFDSLAKFSQRIEPFQAEVSCQINQEQRLFFAKIRPLKSNDGIENGRLLIISDITKAKQIETILNTTHQQSEAAKQKLQHALEKAKAASVAKSSFLKTMGHEIRTPLAGIIGMSNLLKDTPLNAEQKELLATIITNSDALLNIINNLLEFAKIEAGGLKLDRQSFDIRDAVKTLVQPYQLAAAKKSLAFHYHIHKNIPQVFYGDPIRIRQILINLLDNALKFTEEGEIRFTIEPIKAEGSHIELLFTIQDTGIGIPDSFIHQLFQPFKQADAYLTRKYGGSGIGLAISKQLVELMGGRIWVDRQQEKGSAFYFTAVLEQSNQAPQHFLQPQAPTLRDKKLLIIARNAQRRRTISQEARTAGMSPYVAGSSSEVDFWLHKTPFDTALVDVTLLGQKTTKLLQDIHKKYPNLPIILLTSSETNVRVDKAYISGTLYHPISATSFYEVFVKVLSTLKGKGANQPTTNQNNNEMGKRHPLKLLLVEDNPINQKVGRRLLERLGYQIDIAANGIEGVNAVKQKPYDVILMDVQMPLMDGLEATRKIREDISEERQPRIIAVTAHGMEGDKEIFLAAGMDDYIRKPLKLDALIHALNQCVPI